MRAPARVAALLLVASAVAGCRGGNTPTSSATRRGTPGTTFTVAVRGEYATRAGPSADPVYLVTGGLVESGQLSADVFVPDGRIACGVAGGLRSTQCSADYPWDTTGLVLRATADASRGITYSAFAGACGGEGYCALTGNADKMVLVRFMAARTGHPNLSAGAVHGPMYRDFEAGKPGALQCTQCHGANLQGQGLALSCSTCHAWPLPPPADDLTVAVLGLGGTIHVTSQVSAVLSGVAASKAGVARVEVRNLTTGAGVVAAGTTSWSATLGFVEGDNALRITATAGDLAATTATIETTVTYYPALAFTTALTSTRDVLTVGASTAITFTVGLKASAGDTVTLERAAGAGGTPTVVGTMRDDGALPDEIQGDGIYSLGVIETPAATGTWTYRARVTRADGTTYTSEAKELWVSEQLTDQSVTAAVAVANDVGALFASLTAMGLAVADASEAVVASLDADPRIGAAGASPDGAIWWVTSDGLLGLYSAPRPGELAGPARDGSIPGAEIAASPFPPGAPAEYYPAPVPVPDAGSVRALSALARSQLAAAGTANEVRSRQALLISPYIKNPDFTAPPRDLLGSDSYFFAWKAIRDGGWCALDATTAKYNYLSIGVSVEDFKALGSYGYVHLSTHGNNFYQGLLTLWLPEWGASDWLVGSASKFALSTGVKLPPAAGGGYSAGPYAEDLKKKRVAIAADGELWLLPGFFEKYLSPMPNSVVVLTSCRSLRDRSLANVLLQKGAGAVVGYTDYVNALYAAKTAETVVRTLAGGFTVRESTDAAIQLYGASDLSYDQAVDPTGATTPATPAYLEMVGADALVFGSGEKLLNGGFEDGALSAWTRDGDGRVVQKLGQTVPTAGTYMGIISTGLGYTTDSGTISQTFCLPAVAAGSTQKTLSFKWNLFSEEFLEWCYSQFQDTFDVDLCDATGTTCTSLLHRKVDDFCAAGAVTPADIGFDRGGVYRTGWRTQSADVTSFAGKKVKLSFRAGDVGDSVFDTAILLDEIGVSDQ